MKDPGLQGKFTNHSSEGFCSGLLSRLCIIVLLRSRLVNTAQNKRLQNMSARAFGLSKWQCNPYNADRHTAHAH